VTSKLTTPATRSSSSTRPPSRRRAGSSQSRVARYGNFDIVVLRHHRFRPLLARLSALATPPHTRRVASSTSCPYLSAIDWCLRSGGVSDPCQGGGCCDCVLWPCAVAVLIGACDPVVCPIHARVAGCCDCVLWPCAVAVLIGACNPMVCPIHADRPWQARQRSAPTGSRRSKSLPPYGDTAAIFDRVLEPKKLRKKTWEKNKTGLPMRTTGACPPRCSTG